MPVPLPSIQAILGIPGPAFVRKLTRKSHWGDASDPIEERLASALEDVFSSSEGPEYSLYQVATETDLRRVAIGMNSGRDSLTENVDLVAFLPEDLSACGITATNVIENATNCHHANRLHFNIHATREQLTGLCMNAMASERLAGRLSKGTMKCVVNAAEVDGCLAIDPASTQCDCDLDVASVI